MLPPGQRVLGALRTRSGRTFRASSKVATPSYGSRTHTIPTRDPSVSSARSISSATASTSTRGWAATQPWASMQLKPSFNDFVVYRGFVYGFDGAAFCCVDLGTGERRWRKGRYGNGQVLLLADQGVLLVVSDRGEAVLVAADPERHEELGRFQAVKGKTWNHPVIAHGRLYVRNAEEMACYELGAGAGR